MIRKIELLAPAKNLECGIAAIDHGADAVYIGASRFGARVAAGNSIDDISKLCEYAHRFDAKVYVTINTILYDNEIEAAREILRRLVDINVDAVLVQDMALVKMSSDYPSLVLHASTQTDNRNIDKVKWLRNIGFQRVVLARELSLEEIKTIHEAVPEVELEVFVHGAICVSYSGACYASQHCFGRSANRGNCAQFCRLKFNLKDADNNILLSDKYLLSQKDMCRIDQLEDLLDAGVTSFKIEGRLKDISYIKNIVAAYNMQLNRIIANNSDKYTRASKGHVEYSFTPDVSKTFNRGYTNYFLNGRQENMANFMTPKAIGEYVGKVKEIRKDSFNVSGTAIFNNGDGLCFFNSQKQLEGFRVNKVVNNRLFPQSMPRNLKPGATLYRNNDQDFERMLSKNTAQRKIMLFAQLDITSTGFQLTVTDEMGRKATATVTVEHQTAKTDQEENIKLQIGKLGNTHYSLQSLEISNEAKGFFIPSSILSDLRRNVVGALMVNNDIKEQKQFVYGKCDTTCSSNKPEHINLANVANRIAQQFYMEQGFPGVPKAKEIAKKEHGELIMTCRYCIKHELGFCSKQNRAKPQWREPLCLELPDGHKFQLKFECSKCQMKIYAED